MNNKNGMNRIRDKVSIYSFTQDCTRLGLAQTISETKYKRKSPLSSQIVRTLLTYCFMPESMKRRKDRYSKDVVIHVFRWRVDVGPTLKAGLVAL